MFEKSRLYITQTSQFKEPGDYFKFNVIGIKFYFMTKDGWVNAFLDMCRHRAYIILRKEQDPSTVLGGKYHG